MNMTRSLSLASFLSISLSLSIPGYAGASLETPLLTKTSRSGFVPMEFMKEETCDVFADRIVIKRVMGGKTQIVSTETKTHKLDGDLSPIIQSASKGKLSTDSMTTIDTPTYIYLGHMSGMSGSETVTLKEENGMNGSLTFNASPDALLLLNVLDSLCPRAFD